MSTPRSEAIRSLRASGFDIIEDAAENSISFENDSVLGFAIFYATAKDLLEGWTTATEKIIAKHQFELRMAGAKAWNTYALLIAEQDPAGPEAIALSLVEEDLSGFRKIARAGCGSPAELNRALLPLLPLQSSPALEAVDSRLEVRLRATELAAPILEAFLSDADEQVVLQLLEQEG
ncbi:hypothetical protein [Phenylobacterium sp.]|uniref:hypothetical protein n=1 Tax=Phenylobacterium sp. TaxID=1871053 RepID=UPI003D2AB570